MENTIQGCFILSRCIVMIMHKSKGRDYYSRLCNMYSSSVFCSIFLSVVVEAVCPGSVLSSKGLLCIEVQLEPRGY